MNGYPRGFLSALWIVIAVLFVSGVALVPGALELRLGLDLPSQLPGGWRSLIAALHASDSFMMLALLGALAAMHMRWGLRRKLSIRSGLTLVALFMALAVSALVLYYSGTDTPLRWASLVHVVVGVALAAALTVHVVLGRRSLAARRELAHRLRDRPAHRPKPPVTELESPAHSWRSASIGSRRAARCAGK